MLIAVLSRAITALWNLQNLPNPHPETIKRALLRHDWSIYNRFRLVFIGEQSRSARFRAYVLMMLPNEYPVDWPRSFYENEPSYISCRHVAFVAEHQRPSATKPAVGGSVILYHYSKSGFGDGQW